MGTVYFAEQLRLVRRHVALKLIKSGIDSHSAAGESAGLGPMNG
jgi:hypothetical protein